MFSSYARATLALKKYQFVHWLFQWKQDDDGDIAFVIANIITFVKYKEHTMIYFGRNTMKHAPKYVREV